MKIIFTTVFLFSPLFFTTIFATGEFDVVRGRQHNRNVLKVHVWERVPRIFNGKANLGGGRHVAFELDHEYFYSKENIRSVKEDWPRDYSSVTDSRMAEYWGTSDEIGVARKRRFHFPFMSFYRGDSNANILLKRSECRQLAQPVRTLCLYLEGGVEGIKQVYAVFLESLNSNAASYSAPSEWFARFMEQSRGKVIVTEIWPAGAYRKEGFVEPYVDNFQKYLVSAVSGVDNAVVTPPSTAAEKAAADAKKKREEKKIARKEIGEIFDNYNAVSSYLFSGGMPLSVTTIGGGVWPMIKSFNEGKTPANFGIACASSVIALGALLCSVNRYSARKDAFVSKYLEYGEEEAEKALQRQGLEISARFCKIPVAPNEWFACVRDNKFTFSTSILSFYLWYSVKFPNSKIAARPLD